MNALGKFFLLFSIEGIDKIYILCYNIYRN
nr:MAG TPA: hypothetical protein [Caudoviricetes sp.]